MVAGILSVCRHCILHSSGVRFRVLRVHQGCLTWCLSEDGKMSLPPFGTSPGLHWWSAGKYLITSGVGPDCVQFAHLYGVNIPTMTTVNHPCDVTEQEIGKYTHHIQKIHTHNRLPNVLWASACTLLAGTPILPEPVCSGGKPETPVKPGVYESVRSLKAGSSSFYFCLVSPRYMEVTAFLGPRKWLSCFSAKKSQSAEKGMNSFLEPFHQITQGHHF